MCAKAALFALAPQPNVAFSGQEIQIEIESAVFILEIKYGILVFIPLKKICVPLLFDLEKTDGFFLGRIHKIIKKVKMN